MVVPLFALANAGIHLDRGALGRPSPRRSRSASSSATSSASRSASAERRSSPRARRCAAPRPTLSWPILWVGGTIAGIGFTVSLLIASLAFHGERLAEAKLGVLAAAIVAPLIAAALIRAIQHLPAAVRARQIAGTAADLLDLAVDVDPERDHIRGPRRRDRDGPRVRRLRVPLLRPRRGDDPRAARSFDTDLRYVWRHLPLNDVHTHAQLAAEASEAAAAQGRFWDYYDGLFADQEHLTTRDLIARAEALGLDVERFTEDLRRHDYASRIAEDVASADESGVSGTPTFFINGRRYQGAYDVDTLTSAVRAARVRSTALASAPT